MEIEQQPIAALTGFEQNPRTISAAKLASLKESIRTLGLFKPLLVWPDENGTLVVIGGNQRLRAVREMVADSQIEMKEIPTIRYTGSRAQAHTIALRDNNSDGDWDWNELAGYVAELDKLTSATDDLSMTLTGFDDNLLQDLRDLAGSVDADLNRFGSALSDQPEEPEPEPVVEDPEDDAQAKRQIARFTVGSVRGVISAEDYRRFLSVWQTHSDLTKSTDVPTILDSILRELEPVAEAK